jgi:hypothetical protein
MSTHTSCPQSHAAQHSVAAVVLQLQLLLLLLLLSLLLLLPVSLYSAVTACISCAQTTLDSVHSLVTQAVPFVVPQRLL